MTEIRAGPLTRARPEAGQRSRRFFVTGSGTSRRPVDVAIATVGGIIVVLSTMAASNGVGQLDSSVRRVAGDLPGWATMLFDAAYALGAALAAAAAVLALVEVRRRPRLPLTLGLAVAVAAVGALVCSLVVGTGSVESGSVASSTPGSFPVVRVAATTAVLLALRPWLVLAYRRLAVTLVAVQCLAA